MALKNFDEINREKREIQVGGEIADVTRIPSRVMLELIDASDNGEFSEDNPNSFKRTLDMAEKICTPSNPKMTAEFLLDNTDIETLIDILYYIMEPVRAKMEKQAAQQKKNATAQAGKEARK